YLESLKQQAPEQINFDFANFKSVEEWIKAGALIFDAPIDYLSLDESHIRELPMFEKAGLQITKEGIFPFARYVVREKGKVELGIAACSNCHTRVMPDGSTLLGAQGNFPLDRVLAYGFRVDAAKATDAKAFLQDLRNIERAGFATPHLPA